MGLEAKFTGDIDGMFKAFLLEVERQIIESHMRKLQTRRHENE